MKMSTQRRQFDDQGVVSLLDIDVLFKRSRRQFDDRFRFNVFDDGCKIFRRGSRQIKNNNRLISTNTVKHNL